MKKYYFFFRVVLFAHIFISSPLILHAQNASTSSDRANVAVILVTYQDEADAYCKEEFNKINLGTQFDINAIPTKYINISAPNLNRDRVMEASKNNGARVSLVELENPNKNTAENSLHKDIITDILNKMNIGHEIYDFLLQYNQDGFHHELLQSRSLWNANDETVLIDRKREVSTLDQHGEELIKQSYVLVVDVRTTNLRQTCRTNIEGFLYRIKDVENTTKRITEGLWFDEDTPNEEKTERAKAYNAMRIPLEYVGCYSCLWTPIVNGKGPQQAVRTLFGEIRAPQDDMPVLALLGGLKKKVFNLNTSTSTIAAKEQKSGIKSEHYILADIGTKEGLSSKKYYRPVRFALYENKNGKMKKKGYARVVEVADNNYLADGLRPKSKLRQISGAKLNGYEMLQEDADARIALSLGYGYSGVGIRPKQTILGSMSMIYLSLEHLLTYHKWGAGSYFKSNIGFDIITEKQLRNGAMYSGIAFDEKYAYNIPYINISLGYGYGITLFHAMELQPFCNVGVDVCMGNLKTLFKDIKSDSPSTGTAGYIEPGVKLSINCGYPFQFFIQSSFPCIFAESESANQYARRCGYGHAKTNVALGAGIKWNF